MAPALNVLLYAYCITDSTLFITDSVERIEFERNESKYVTKVPAIRLHDSRMHVGIKRVPIGFYIQRRVINHKRIMNHASYLL